MRNSLDKVLIPIEEETKNQNTFSQANIKGTLLKGNKKRNIMSAQNGKLKHLQQSSLSHNVFSNVSKAKVHNNVLKAAQE